jgi:hydroxyacylglutathione hydrolase
MGYRNKMRKIFMIGFSLLALGCFGQKVTMNDPQIYRIHMGVSNPWLIKGEKAVLIDAGMPDKFKSFKRQLSRLSIEPSDIRLVVLTHGHFDHIGLAHEIRELTGAKIAIHESDRPLLEEGKFIIPEGTTAWGRFARKALMPIMKKLGQNIKPVKADIVLDNNPFSLEEYGITGRIIPTPGHTLGSVSVILDNGDAFVGCMAQNRLPFTLHPQLPIFADHMELFQESWAYLASQGAKRIYPSHGGPFKINKVYVPKGMTW